MATAPSTVSDPRGLKRICLSCSTRFYDFNKRPVVCPNCDTEYTGDVKVKSRKARGGSDLGKAVKTSAKNPKSVADMDDEDYEMDEDDLDDEAEDEEDEDDLGIAEVDMDADGDLDEDMDEDDNDPDLVALKEIDGDLDDDLDEDDDIDLGDDLDEDLDLDEDDEDKN